MLALFLFNSLYSIYGVRVGVGDETGGAVCVAVAVGVRVFGGVAVLVAVGGTGVFVGVLVAARWMRNVVVIQLDQR